MSWPYCVYICIQHSVNKSFTKSIRVLVLCSHAPLHDRITRLHHGHSRTVKRRSQHPMASCMPVEQIWVKCLIMLAKKSWVEQLMFSCRQITNDDPYLPYSTKFLLMLLRLISVATVILIHSWLKCKKMCFYFLFCFYFFILHNIALLNYLNKQLQHINFLWYFLCN